MGAVTVDTKKSERPFEQLTLSDINVVKYLILHRSTVDIAYGKTSNVNISQAGDLFEFNQELVCLYISLDDCINKIGLNEKETALLELIFEGNTIADVINVHELYAKKTAYRTLNRIIDNIVEMNYQQWKATYNKSV